MGFQWRGAPSVAAWEKPTAGFLDRLRLRSITSKVIVFALLATLIPAVSMGWLSYRNNRRVIDQKIAHELTNVISQAAREFELSIEERRYELRVFSNSYEISENLEILDRAAADGEPGRLARERLEAYLDSVGERFPDYEELLLMGAAGNVLAPVRARSESLSLPEGWLDRVKADESVIGTPFVDGDPRIGVVAIAEPIRAADGGFLGVLAAKVNFDKIAEVLRNHAKDPSHRLYVVTTGGQVLVEAGDPATMASKLDAVTARNLFAREKRTFEFVDFRGNEVVGALKRISGVGWGVVAQKDRADAYSAIIRLRNFTLGLIASVSLVIGAAAYLLCLTIAPPLRRLAAAATAVAEGDLEVNLPVYGRNEVSRTTNVFNEMVARLRAFRDENARINRQLRRRNAELRELSITDGLTGLYNRTYMPQMLAKELARSRRHRHSFSILMIDIDHFKRFNDTHGHQAGDEVLVNVAEILRDSIRACDYAARYGGEEFLVLLTESGREGAGLFAEKLRRTVERMKPVSGATVTASIGVASFPEDGDSVEAIVREADVALYRCKRQGRNRVVLAGERPEPARNGKPVSR